MKINTKSLRSGDIHKRRFMNKSEFEQAKKQWCFLAYQHKGEQRMTESEVNDKQVTVVMVGNSEDTLVNLIHKVMNGKYDERNNKRDSKKTK